MANLPRHVQRYHDAFLKAGVVDELQMRSALGHLERWGGRLANVLVELQFAREEDLVRLISETLRMPVLRVDPQSIHPSLAQRFDGAQCARDGYVPLSLEKRTLHVAMADPGDVRLVDELQSKHQARVKVSLAPESEIRDAIDRLFYGGTSRTAVRPLRDGAPRDGAGFIPESQMVEATFELDGSLSDPGAAPPSRGSQVARRPPLPEPLAAPRPSSPPPLGAVPAQPSGPSGTFDWARALEAPGLAPGPVDFGGGVDQSSPQAFPEPPQPFAEPPQPFAEPPQTAAPGISSLSGFLGRPPSAGTLLDELLTDPTVLDATERLSATDLARLEKARANQQKSAMILRAVVSLLTERGLLRQGEL